MQNVYKETMRRTINKQAEAIFNKMKLEPGFNIKKFVETLDGEITENSDLGDGIEARIRATEDKQNFIIECKELDRIDDRYTRFAIAHEIGHLLLHMIIVTPNNQCIIEGNYNKDKDNISDDFSYHYSSIKEWEAEEFAAAFLMPENLFRLKVEVVWANDNSEDKIEQLADIFKVPYKSIITRGKSLEIW